MTNFTQIPWSDYTKRVAEIGQVALTGDGTPVQIADNGYRPLSGRARVVEWGETYCTHLLAFLPEPPMIEGLPNGVGAIIGRGTYVGKRADEFPITHDGSGVWREKSGRVWNPDEVTDALKSGAIIVHYGIRMSDCL